MKRLVIVDGSGFIYRAFFALPQLTKSDGTPVGAVFGFTKMLLSMLTNNSMDYFVIIFDKTKKTFRHDIYPEYKQNRKETPPELKSQFKVIRNVCDAFNVPYIEESGFEADDLIAAYTNLAKSEGFLIKIVSGDKDLIQLLSNGVELYDPLKVKAIDANEVLLKYGIKPEQMIDFLALCGDASDNIPGVSSVGPKTASALLNEFGSLEKIFTAIESMEERKKIHERILAQKNIALLSQQLATINANAPTNSSIETFKIRNINIDEAKKFLEEQEFTSLISKLINLTQENPKTIPQNLENNPQNINHLISDIEKCGYVFITEHSIKTCNENEIFLSKEQLSEKFHIILEKMDIKKITTNAKFLFHINENLCNFEDIAIMSFLINGKNGYYPLSKTGYDILKQQLLDTRQSDYYENVEKPLIKILFQMEKVGIALDSDVLQKLSTFFIELLGIIKDNVSTISGQEINLDSPKQVSKLLFEDLKIPYIKQNKKSGNISTNQEILEELANRGYEIAEYILQWRQISKLNSTYTTPLVASISKNTGRIHTSFNMTSTLTGRLSSSDPNLQNIPVKTNVGKKIREAFVATEGNVLVSVDFSQIELRILAHLSKCPKLLQAFQEDLDIHKITASEIFHVPLQNVSEDLRRKAKAINFGIIYGMSSFGVSKKIHISNKESEIFIENYFNKYPEVEHYIKSTIEFAKKEGYVETILNRRCFIKDIQSSNFHLRKFAERQAVNAPIQGSSADITYLSMLAITQNPDIFAKMILQIHDELIFEVEEKHAEQQAKEIQKTMETLLIIECPLKVNCSIGKNWSKL